MNIRDMREESLKIATRAKSLLDTITAENAGEKNIEFDSMMEESDELAARANRLEAVEQRSREMSEIVTPLADGRSEARSDEGEQEKRDRAFDRYLRGQISGAELRAMGVAVDSKGGFTVEKTLSTQIISSLQSRGPMLDPSVVNYLTTEGGNPINFPKFDDTAKATIVGENTVIAQEDMAFGQVSLGAYKYTSRAILISRELLEDSAVNVADIISNAASARIGRGVNEHLTTGSTASTQPTGLATSATVGVTASTMTAFTYDNLVDLMHSLDPAYRPRSRWMLNDTIIATVRKMKDSTGVSVWQPGMSLASPETILGRPFLANPDMPLFGASAKTVLFGDFSGYTVRQARAIEIRRLDERYADSDQVGFFALARFDGNLLDTASVRALRQAAA